MSDICNAIEAVTKVIANSNEKVLLVSGALTHHVYESQQVKDTISNALKRNVEFDIIVGPDYDKKSVFILGALKNSIWLAPEWPEHHFVVGDDKHIRYEKDHKNIDGLLVANNMVALNVPDVAEYLTARFYELKPSCTRLVETKA
jgi:hypothetical protein